MKWYVCFCEPKRAREFCSESGGEEAGFYCPTFLSRRRDPRGNKTRTVELPLIGGIFFCRTDAWRSDRGVVAGVDSGALVRMKNVDGEFGLVTDRELDGLRLSAAELTRRKARLRAGQRVVIEFGALAGLVGTVVQVRGEEYTVSLDEGLEIKIRGFLLRRTEL